MTNRLLHLALAALAAAALGSCHSTKATAPSDAGTPPPDGAPSPTTDDPGSTAQLPPTVSVYFAASQADVEAGNWTTTFPVFDTREIFVVAFWEPREGTHVERLEYYTPDGALYRSVEIAYTSEKLRQPRSIALPGHVGRIVVHYAPRGLGVGVAVVDHLTVSGTPILANLVTGSWSVRLYWDGAGPLASSAFEVQR